MRPAPLRVLSSPVFLREMRSSGRRWTTYLIRFGAVGLSLFVASIGYLAVRGETAGMSSAGELQRLQEIAPGITVAMAWVGFAGISLIGPLLGAPTISDEKRARTLSALATSPLSSAEIIFGHFLARFALLAIVLLAPMPLLLGMRMFGGVPAEFILGSAATLLSHGALGIALAVLLSINAKRSTNAFFGAFAALMFIGVTPFIWLAMSMGTGVVSPPDWTWFFSAPGILAGLSADLTGETNQFNGLSVRALWTLGAACQLALAGAVLFVGSLRFRAMIRVETAGGIETRDASDKKLGKHRVRRGFSKLSRWVVYLAAVALPICVAVLAGQDEGPRVTAAMLIFFGVAGAGWALLQLLRSRAAKKDLSVGDRALLWRELSVPLFSPRFRMFYVVVGLFGVLMPIVGYGDAGDAEIYFPLAIILMLISIPAVAIITPGAIAQERESRSWDVLLTTPSSAGAILLSKSIGGLRRAWPAPFALMTVLTIGVLAGALHAPLLGLIAIMLLGLGVFITGTGILSAMLFRKSVSAAACNLAVLLFLWLVVPIAISVSAELIGQSDTEFLGLTNPMYMFVATVAEADLPGRARFEYAGFLDVGFPGAYAVISIFSGIYAAAGVLCIVIASMLFNRFGGRAS